MKINKILFFSSILVLSVNSHATDTLVTTIYAPTINISPSKSMFNFPNTLPIHLLINKKGKVEDIKFPKDTKDYVKNEIRNSMKIAEFSPYLKDGQAIKSIVPFTVRFNIISEEDYSGDAD